MAKKQILEEIADEIGGRLREGYSGRGMFGKECLGIVCDDAIGCIEAAGAKGITGAKTDNMGKSMIVYWPNLSEDQLDWEENH
jgi:hypothetical protein